VRWLAGKEPASAPVHLHTTVCELYQLGEARLEGLAEAAYSPDWIFRFHGGRIARIHGFGPPLESDAVRVGLRDARSISFVTDAAPSRTQITLERGTRAWSFAPPLSSDSGGHIACAENTFDVLHLESFDQARNRPMVALYAEGSNKGSGATFSTVSTVQESHTESLESFKIPLVSARYLRLFGRSHHAGEQAFLARLSPTPVSITVQGCRMEVAGGGGVPPFELLHHPAHGQSLCCEPAIQAISVPLPGAIAEPLQVGPGTSLQVHPQDQRPWSYLVASPLLQDTLKSQQLITPPPSSPSPLNPRIQPGAIVEKQPGIVAALESDFRFQLKVGGPGSVSVVRPEDLLVLQIAWQGLELRITPGPPQLVRAPSQAGVKPRLTIAFPPQHIGEESFHEEANPQNSQPLKFPIQGRLAGWSRLIFEIPDEIQAIPYTLERLLDWSQLRPVVAPVAWPPPAEPVPSSGFILRLPKDLSPILQTPRLLYPQSFHQRSPALPRWYAAGPSSHVVTRIAAVLSRSEARPFPVQLQQRDMLIQKDLLIAPPASAAPTPQQPFRPGVEAVSPLLRIITQLPPASARALAAYSSIEMPYRLFLSPSPLGAWSHAVKPVVLNGRHELWHTRLGVKRPDGSVSETDSWYRTLRAIWSPDYADDVGKGPDYFDRTGPSAKNPFRMLPEANHRHQLVHLMANGTLGPESDLSRWQLRVARAQKFMLSSLGAWTDLRYGDPDPPSGLTLVEWRQITSMGRDQYVRVVEKGFLFPFGHRALLVRVTERKFERVDGRIFAVLRYRVFIVVLEPIKKYPAAGHPASARDFAFQQIHITTKVTPNLSPPVSLPDVVGGQAFWPQLNGQDFQFHILATDWAGQTSEFSTPLMFVDGNVGTNWEGTKGGQIEKVAARYNSPDPVAMARRTCALDGQKVAFAPTGGGSQTTLEAVSVLLKASTIAGNPSGKKHPLFFPHVEASKVLIPPLKQLIGKDVTTIHYFSGYIAQGFGGPNPGEVFAVLDPPEQIRFPTNKSGGIAAPNFTLTGLSRRLGPVGGDLGVVAGSREVNAADFFTTVAARGDGGPSQDAANILGCLPLGSAVKGKLASFLKLQELPPAEPNSRWVILNLETDLSPLPSNDVPIFVPWLGFPPTMKEADLPSTCCRAKLSLHVHSKTPIARQGMTQAKPRSGARGSLTNFQLNFGILIVSFKEIGFTVKVGEGARVVLRLAEPDPVRFAGPLTFLEIFRKFIANDVLGTIPIESLADRAKGVANLTVPSIPMGMFSFSNVGFTIGFDLPYDNSPMAIDFGFGAYVSVGPYGGGASFALGFCADGIRKLEMMVEFGGRFNIDLFVAQGSASIAARIYYKLEFLTYQTFPWRGIKLTLEGSVRMSGHVSVLDGLVGAGIDFELRLELEIGTEENRIYGKAEMSVKVELLWHEESVSIPIVMEFKIPRVKDGQDGVAARGIQGIGGAILTPVKVSDVFSERDWMQHSEAFAVD
jgi:hypothetical protein